MGSPKKRIKQAGLTLIELMIVVVIVAVLAAIAIPSYNQYVLRSHRANARAALIQVAHWMERAATASGTYPICNTVIDPNPPACQVPAGVRRVDGNRYRIEVNSTAATFALSAIPLGEQSVDRCAAYTLDQANNRGQLPNGPVTTPLSADECWRR